MVDSWCGELLRLPGTLVKTYLHAPGMRVADIMPSEMSPVWTIPNKSLHPPILKLSMKMLSGTCLAQAAAHCTIFSESSVRAASLMQSPSLRGLEEPLGTRSEFTQVPLVLLSSRYHWCGSCRSELYQQTRRTVTRIHNDRKADRGYLPDVHPPRETSIFCSGTLISGARGASNLRP